MEKDPQKQREFDPRDDLPTHLRSSNSLSRLRRATAGKPLSAMAQNVAERRWVSAVAQAKRRAKEDRTVARA